MKNNLISLFLGFALLLAPASAQIEKFWEQHFCQAQKADIAGENVGAERCYKQAVQEAEQFDEYDPRLSLTLVKFGQFYLKRHQSQDAEILLKRALEIYRHLKRSQYLDLDLAVLMKSLANAYILQLKLQEAEMLLKKVIVLQSKLLPAGDAEIGFTLHQLVLVMYAQEKFEQTEKYCKQAINIAGKHQLDVRTLRLLLADIYVNLGKYKQAEETEREALTQKRRCSQPQEVHIARGLDRLALSYHQAGQATKAALLFKSAIAIGKTAKPTFDEDLALISHHLGDALVDLGRYIEAEKLYKTALELRKKLSHTDALDLAMNLKSLANLYTHQGKYSVAQSLYQQALSSLKNKSEDRYLVHVLGKYASVLRKCGKLAQAETLERQALKLQNKIGQLSKHSLRYYL